MANAEQNTPKWLSVDTAWQRLEQAVPNYSPEHQQLPIQAATGFTLAQTLTSAINLPPADNSAMDGFAVRLADIVASNSLPISQRIPAGTATQPLTTGTAARIFTGSEIPDGADTVIMQENCNYNDQEVSFIKLPELGANIRLSGSDITQQQTLLPTGHRLRPQDIGLLAATGIATVAVFKSLKVALIATGDELTKPGEPLLPGKIYESNAPMVSSLLEQYGADVTTWFAPDELEQTTEILSQAADQADLVITIGGVSVGEEDHVKTALNRLGTTDFWKIGLKPGKPFLLGNINNKPMMGLPGNPVSAFITCALFCKPFIRKMQGGQFFTPHHWQVPAAFERSKPDARQQYLRGKLVDGKATVLAKQSSAVMTSLCEADILVVIPVGTPVAYDDTVQVISLTELINH